jgi:hypothetical protein
MNELTYLATPYMHIDNRIMKDRFDAVTFAAGRLMSKGKIIFSPITHCHPIAQLHDLPRDWEFWKTFDTVYLNCSKEMYILGLPGWEGSTGVTAERQIMRELNRPVFLLDPVDYSLALLST